MKISRQFRKMKSLIANKNSIIYQIMMIAKIFKRIKFIIKIKNNKCFISKKNNAICNNLLAKNSKN